MKLNYLLLIVIIAFSSCRSFRNAYSPSNHNNPFFTSKGDSKVGVYLSGGGGDAGKAGITDKNIGMDVQAAYALGNQFAVVGNFSSRKERDLYGEDYYDTSTVNYTRKTFDIGAGFFVPLDAQKRVTFNFYGGLGPAKFTIRDEGYKAGSAYTRFHNAKLLRWYLQSSFNFMGATNFKLGLDARVVGIRFGQIKTDYDLSEQSYFHIERLNKNMFLFFEPSMTMQYQIPNAEWLKIEGSFALVADWNTEFPSTRHFNGSIGVVIDPSWFKNKSAASK